MADKDSFVFYSSFFEALQDLKDKDRLKLYDAICNLALKNIETELDGLPKTIFTLIKPQILANNQRYENGKKGGRPKKDSYNLSKEKTTGFEIKKTIGFEKEETKTKPNVNVNDNVNVNVNVNDNVNALGFFDDNVAKIEEIFVETLGSTNLNNIQECIDYLEKLPLDVIEYALRKTARKGAKWDYAVRILENYVDKKLDNLQKVKADEIEFKNRTSNVVKLETEEEKNARKIKELEEAVQCK